MERRFAPIRVSEPTEEETLRMLRGLRPSMEKHHGVVIDNDALQAAITLSCRYLKGRYLPDKAIDLIDEAAARACTQNTEGYDKNAFVDALKKRKFETGPDTAKDCIRQKITSAHHAKRHRCPVK